MTSVMQGVPGSFRLSSPDLSCVCVLKNFTDRLGEDENILLLHTDETDSVMMRTDDASGPPPPQKNMSQPPRSGVRSIPSARSLPGACGVRDDGRLRPHSEPLLSPESPSADKRHRWQRWVLSRTRTLTRLWFVLRLFSSSSLIAADI